MFQSIKFCFVRFMFWMIFYYWTPATSLDSTTSLVSRNTVFSYVVEIKQALISRSRSSCKTCTVFLPRCMKCRRGLAMRILSVCPSVRPSVCLSVKRVDCDKTEEKSVQIQYHAIDNLVYIWQKEWWWGDPFYLKFWVNRPPWERNRQFWTDNRSYRLSRNT